MKLKDLQTQVAPGEDSTRQFKADVRNAESLASELAAFANSEGGTLFIGVTDRGELAGLEPQDVARINQLISNAASQLVRSPLTVTTQNVALKNGRVVIVLTVPKGIDKPYFDKNGVIWLKTGADKRRVNSKEELRRLFQMSSQFHADELPTKAGIDKLDKLRFRDFLRDVYKQPYPDDPQELTRLLQNMNLATDQGQLNLAGVLMFAERPEWIMPQFVVKAIRYPGNQIHSSEYLDTEDFPGPLRQIFDGSLSFVMRNLHKIQAGRGVNSPGRPEIPESVFEELLVNALVHRDYLVSAPIRVFIFDNRIEIISPGHLPNNLTVEKIRTGNSNIRNPILVSYVAKGLLPYHGLGSGVKRALADWPAIEFEDDRDGCLFKATVHRRPIAELELVEGENGASVETVVESAASVETAKPSEELAETSGKTSGKIGLMSEKMSVETGGASGETVRVSGETPGSSTVPPKIARLVSMMLANPAVTIPELSKALGITERSVERNIRKLQQLGRIRRVGPTKGGRWQVLD